jgi:hypothetical protein
MKSNLKYSAGVVSQWAPKDSRPMYEWARGIRLPKAYAMPGPFSTSTTRQLEPVMAAIQNESVREVTVCKAIQTGGTLSAVEIPIAYFAANEPGPMMWTQQTDKAVKEHSKGRFNSFIRKIPQIKAILPPGRHDVTTTEIYFGDFFLIINAANINSLQSKSIRYKFNSECWLWEQGLLKQARGRVSKFEEVGTSKIVNESQASFEGDDFHKAYLAGSQSVWSVKCFGCGLYSPLEFFGRDASNPEKKACVIWNQDAKKKDGTWDVDKAAGSARWACINCGHEHADTPRTRTLWNADGQYVSQNPTAASTHKSFRWTALVSRPLSALVTEFLNANASAKMGLIADLRDFKMQRLSMFWKEDDNSEAILLKSSGYSLAGLDPKAKIENEANRFITIDRQRDHFWLAVRAWRRDGGSRLLYFSRVTTSEQCEEIRIQYGVEPQLTFEDAGYFPEGVYTDCTRYGWTALKGSGDNFFTVVKNDRKIKRLWSDASMVQHNGKMLPLFHWASDPIKDVLYNLRSGKGAAWETPDDIGGEYPNQLSGDRKKPFLNKKTGRPEFRWQRTHANHAHDLEAMQTVVSMMLGILLAPSPIDQEDKPTT